MAWASSSRGPDGNSSVKSIRVFAYGARIRFRFLVLHSSRRSIGRRRMRICKSRDAICRETIFALILTIRMSTQKLPKFSRDKAAGMRNPLVAVSVEMIYRNYNPNPVSRTRRRYSWRVRFTLCRKVLIERPNERAMTAIQGDLQGDDLSLLWEDEKLTPLEGFHWYGTNHFSAPNGVYLGFRIGGVSHARIQKIRHGWRGVALVPPESDLSALSKRTGMKYSRVGAGEWFVWSTE